MDKLIDIGIGVVVILAMGICACLAGRMLLMMYELATVQVLPL